MANSKANIYPIQLQGAELNLNKYDAEIKQYSGFNKNNSPFVGGCLANVFTKDEHLDAETESMYIDTNGDVYTVDENALYCNGVTLFKFNRDTYTQCNFWQNEKLDVAEDVVFIYSENLILKKNDNALYINDVEVWHNYENLSDINDILTRKCTGTFFNEDLFVFAGVMYVNSQYTVRVCFFNKNGDFIGRGSHSLNANYYGLGNIAILKPTEDSNGLCVTFNGGFWIYFRYTLDPFSIYMSAYKFKTTDFHYDGSGTPVTHLLTYSLQKCICTNYPSNKLFCFSQDSYTPSQNVGIYYVLEIKGLYWTGGSEFSGDAYLDINGLYYKAMYTLKSNDTINWKYLFENASYTPHFCCFDFFIYGREQLSITEEYSFPFHIASGFGLTGDYINGFAFNYKQVYSKWVNYYVAGSTAYQNWEQSQRDNKKIGLLFNNNELSGIAGDFCLFTDWNTVDINSIFINGNICYYKQNGIWNKLSPSTPKLKRIGNQIIVNVDYYNSWDIKKKEKLLFAPNFNLSFSKEPNHFAEFEESTPDLAYFVAGARNEYSQEKNSSLMLNPIHLKKQFAQGRDSYPYKYEVNYYQGYTIDAINYLITLIYSDGMNIEAMYKKSLVDMIFPIQTDGNVQYSPCLFSKIESQFGNQAFIKSGNTSYPLAMGNNNEAIMAYYLASGVENLDKGFIIQGQFYGLLNNGIYSLQFSNGVVTDVHFIVDIANMQYVGNTPYMAIFFSKTNRCLYAFIGANILNKLQFVDKISKIKEYGYNPTTQTNILITDIGVIMLSSFGTFLLEYTDIVGFYLQDEGICLYNDSGDYHFIKYYKTDNDGYTKQNIRLETCFYGMNNQTVTINDCLYVRLFSEEHESGDVEMTASTLSNYGRMTEKTTFKIKSSDWDKMTHSIYLRYQPKEQRGLGVSFSINSPFKIAALSVGSQPDAILIDKVSKTAINAPQRTTNNSEW